MRLAILLSIFITLFSTAFSQPQIVVQPLSLYEELFQQQTVFNTVTIENPGDDTLFFRLNEEPSGTDQEIRILAWTAYSDVDQEWEHTLEALDMYLTDYELTETNTTSPIELEDLLSNKTCFLIPEQETAPSLITIGQSWQNVLQNFLNSGGIIVGLDHTGDVESLYNGSGLLDIDILDTSTSNINITVLNPSHPFFLNMPTIFAAMNGNNWHISINGESLANYGAENHLTFRNIGSGMIVYWGVDFYTYNEDMALLLCNMVSSIGGLSWLDYRPEKGYILPGEETEVTVRLQSESLSPGFYYGILKIKHNAGLQQLPIGITMLVRNSIESTNSTDDIINNFEYEIGKIFPNPFNAKTNIKFSLDEAMPVNITIYNHMGRMIEELVDGTFATGEHHILWNAENYASGIYFIRIKTVKSRTIQKVLLIK